MYEILEVKEDDLNLRIEVNRERGVCEREMIRIIIVFVVGGVRGSNGKLSHN